MDSHCKKASEMILHKELDSKEKGEDHEREVIKGLDVSKRYREVVVLPAPGNTPKPRSKLHSTTPKPPPPSIIKEDNTPSKGTEVNPSSNKPSSSKRKKR